MDNSVLNGSIPLFPRQQPGIYMIHCKSNDYRYYGESNNLSQRIASHKSMLRRKIHSNSVLQADWNLLGEPQFEFVVLYMGEDWSAREARLQMESSLIQIDSLRVYNCFDSIENRVNPFLAKRHSEKTKALMSMAKRGIPNDLLGRRISVDGQIFPSISEASRQTGIARKTIKKRVDSPDCPLYFDVGRNMA